MFDSAANRRMMVDCQLRTFDVTDRAVLGAFEAVPREAFVLPEQRELAYSDATLPLPVPGRFLLKPMVLARMIQSLSPLEGEKALLIAGSTGYAAAILARMGVQVILLESEASLAEKAEACLGALGVAGVEIVTGSLEMGAPETAPYDMILIEGVVELVPDSLNAQLADGGRMVALQGNGPATKAMLYRQFSAASAGRTLFDASGPTLEAFARPRQFVF